MSRTPKSVAFDEKTSAEIVRLRDDEGYKWGAISDAMEIPSGKAMLIYNFAKVPKKDRIKNATGEDIARLRDDEHLSWGVISARTGYPEGSCRSMYAEHTGTSARGNRIGKGGRLPGDVEPKPKAEKAPKAPKSEKPAKAPKPASKPGKLDGLTPEEVKEAIEGYAIQVSVEGSEPDMIKVKAVKKVAKGSIVLTDDKGAGRTIKQAAVIAISKKRIAV
jgi:hypothetical protein